MFVHKYNRQTGYRFQFPVKDDARITGADLCKELSVQMDCMAEALFAFLMSDRQLRLCDGLWEMG